MEIDKDKIIHDVYYSPSGYSSMSNTLADAKKKKSLLKWKMLKSGSINT